MPDTDNPVLEALGYHDQPELPCCENCAHANYYGYLECAKAHYAHVEASGICRKFEQWRREDQ